ncbi:GNAT family N-acetyltransferase [Bacillus massilinigeriensis]|uniref:GNAT family N-acetyltransferase n=1 Tax=Bacillus mediterraneensis TaxID=1805474 RepID=UPI0008F8406B|nr:GNAT family N-acetyltransferase [Bacillus mediterraneensis]
MRVLKLTEKYAHIYRQIRLDALKNNPEAFASSFEEEQALPEAAFAARLGNESSFTFGAWIGEELAGVVTLSFEKKRKLSHRANIFAMYVTPKNRNKGIAKALMNEAIMTAKSMESIEQVILGVVAGNLSAKKLYESLGFKTYGYDRNALKIDGYYYDEVYMVLYL